MRVFECVCAWMSIILESVLLWLFFFVHDKQCLKCNTYTQNENNLITNSMNVYTDR